MKIDIQTQSPSESKLQAVFKVRGRNREVDAEPKELSRGLDNRQVVAAAYEGDRLVGVGRVASNGLLCAWIYDMIVDPEFRGLGIGTQVLRALVGWCEARHIGDIRTFPTRSSRGFFESNGFAARPDGEPGLQYSRELDRLSRVTRSPKEAEGLRSALRSSGSGLRGRTPISHGASPVTRTRQAAESGIGAKGGAGLDTAL